MWTRLVLARTCLVAGCGSRSHFCQDHSASAAHGKTSGTCGKGRFCPSDVRKDVSVVLKVPFCQSGARKDVSAVLKVPFCPSDVTKEPMTRQKSSAEWAALSSPAQRLICSSRRSYFPAALPLSPVATFSQCHISDTLRRFYLRVLCHQRHFRQRTQPVGFTQVCHESKSNVLIVNDICFYPCPI